MLMRQQQLKCKLKITSIKVIKQQVLSHNHVNRWARVADIQLNLQDLLLFKIVCKSQVNKIQLPVVNLVALHPVV